MSSNPVKKAFDYSKWDNIELSDDEEDVHPNIERESWFRMKHRSRVEREEREEADKKRIRDEMAVADLRIRELSLQLSRLGKNDNDDNDEDDDDDDDDDLEDVEGLKAELTELQEANQARQDKLDSYEKHKKWNVDNMCRVVEERTVVNKETNANFTSSGYALPTTTSSSSSSSGKEQEGESEKEKEKEKKDEKEATTTTTTTKSTDASTSSTSGGGKASTTPTTAKASSSTSSQTPAKTAAKKLPQVGPDRRHVVSMMSYHEFTQEYADVVEAFMALESLDASRDCLLQHGTVLLQENASNYLLLASLEDEMNGFREKMRLTARQSQIISNIAELAKSLQTHPGNVVTPFFQRLQQREFLEGFLEGVESFCQKIIARAVVKKREMDAEREKEQEAVELSSIPKEERLGPGGLDPVEVFESLPLGMQEAFEARDTDMLKRALMEMDPKEAEGHLKRCVDSGLWNEG